jgi:hypothetical protein
VTRSGQHLTNYYSVIAYLLSAVTRTKKHPTEGVFLLDYVYVGQAYILCPWDNYR